MTSKTDMLATRVEGIRPPVPAANSQDAGTNALHTDIAAAEDMIDTHAAPPPAKAADPDGFEYCAFRHSTFKGSLYRRRGSVMEHRNAESIAWDQIEYWPSFDPAIDERDFGPATRAACERFLGWPKPNPDDHGDNGQSARTLAATVARVHGPYYHAVTEPIVVSMGEHPAPEEPIPAIPTCAACGSPKPTDATGADIVREYLRLSIVWNEKGAGLIGPAGDEAWYVARNRAAYDVTQFLGANLPALRAALGGVA